MRKSAAFDSVHKRILNAKVARKLCLCLCVCVCVCVGPEFRGLACVDPIQEEIELTRAKVCVARSMDVIPKGLFQMPKHTPGGVSHL